MGKIALKRFELIVLCMILSLGAFLRLYRISAFMTFLGDEGRDALVVRDILLGRNFPLIGPGTSVGNMYLGPLYYYLISPSLLLANFSPLGPAIFVALIGILTIALIWWVARQWQLGTAVNLIICALYAVSPVVVNYSHSSWNPNVMPFFSLLCIYGVWRIWQKSDRKWYFITAVSFAFVLNSHYLGLLLFPTLGLFTLISKNLRQNLSWFLISVAALCLLLSPLVIFDWHHNWTNFNALKTFLTDRQQTVNLKPYKSLPNIWPIWTDINTTLLTAGNKQLGQFVSVVLLLSLVFIVAKKPSPEIKLLLVWIGVGLIGLGLYKQHIYAHYYGFLFPAPFILLGLILKSASKPFRYLLFGLSGILLVFNLINHPLRSEPNNQLSRTRQIAEFITSQAGGQPYNLALISNHNYDASYRYFLAVAGSPYFPLQQLHTGQLFVICEDPVCQPINHPLYEIAAFGWSKIDREWSFPWQVKLYRLIPNPQGV